jgi:hypothetical protein
MAISIPNVFHHSTSAGDALANGSAGHDSAPWFGVAYMAVQLLVLAMQGTEAWRDRATREAFIDFVS